MRNIIFLTYICFFVIIQKTYALSINEIYPAPSRGDVEWIELFNETSEVINTKEYKLEDDTQKQIVIPQIELSPKEYCIATSSSILNNTGDTIRLFKGEDVMQEISYTGSFLESVSYTRCESQWTITSQITKGQDNTPACINPTPTQTLPTTISGPEISGLIISEVHPFPHDDTEWVELFNTTGDMIRCENCAIDDIEGGGSSPIQFSATIPAQGYYIVELTTNILNNTGDTVRLLNSRSAIIDTLFYPEAQEGISFGKNLSSSACMQNPSPHQPNTPCLATTISPSPSPTSQQIVGQAISEDTVYPSLYTMPHIKTLIFNTSQKKPQETSVLGTHIKETYQKTLLPHRFLIQIFSCISIITSATCFFSIILSFKTKPTTKNALKNEIKGLQSHLRKKMQVS